jgi:hypothetical protein
LENLVVDGGMILELIFKKLVGGVPWIELARDKNRWQDLVNTVLKI